MKSNQFWVAAIKLCAAAAVILIVVLVLTPGAWAASKYKVLHKFTGGTDGSWPQDRPVLDASGNLYGTTRYGGAYGDGNVFELTRNSDGTWTETVLYSFSGGSDGANPWASLIFDSSGNLYSTTPYGGAYGYGTAFELTPNSDGTWTESVLYSFTGAPDGAYPQAGLTLDVAGNLYGMTTEGGNGTHCSGGCGVVFKLTPHSGGEWTESVLHRFTGEDGSDPYPGRLMFDAAGHLYGTASAVYNGGPCCGTLFELVASQDGSWKEKVLHHFTGGGDGGTPGGAPVFDRARNLYGATDAGGDGYGVVFKLIRGAKGQWTEYVLYTFKGNEDGAYAQDGVTLDAAGNVYGTTFYGEDAHGNCCWGQVYELLRHHGWAKQVLHYFEGPPNDGGNPAAGVVFDAKGNIYGTTCDGGPGKGAGCASGSSGFGVVYEIVK